jgi:hypothetical protein
MALLDAAFLADLPTAPRNLKMAFPRDPAWRARHTPEIGPRFQRSVKRPVMAPKKWTAR